MYGFVKSNKGSTPGAVLQICNDLGGGYIKTIGSGHKLTMGFRLLILSNQNRNKGQNYSSAVTLDPLTL